MLLAPGSVQGARCYHETMLMKIFLRTRGRIHGTGEHHSGQV